MLKNIIFKSTAILFFLTMVIFTLVQVLFRTQEYFQFSQFQYLIATAVSNAFVLTTLYAVMAAYNMIKQTNHPNLHFFKVFGLCFSPGVLAGFMSLIAIFAFFYYIQPDWIEQFKNEYLDYSLLDAKEAGDYDSVAKVVNSQEVRNTNILNIRTFSLISIVIAFFNFSLGIMMALLWKVRTTPSKPNA
ncbi:DUF4199 domain-containing protein [Ornithobacterium rhinotracheale]|uniref:DUF4199 domain-containing protein n=1 Tax=Ornithobacterium rhinotracheale TaxID=28251 RepID=UPI00129C1D50|nr:DUF4199 domain-containing protein [Ornithobacterium rhinotracheale]MRI63959.1 DUF4199 domain-containing protein [Ornithobacterium rhinotracheale]MRJ08725.1 DUF4199 domain-containing protein [Ornithobacterium rhinotracheale]MRJ10709.1 DUF4199 domain-containing protein [Ornithobacterium rhinotracheale]UOH77131.1 DUF4199 domain-containing protein [Ornithobacterium rhinotracheale]